MPEAPTSPDTPADDDYVLESPKARRKRFLILIIGGLVILASAVASALWIYDNTAEQPESRSQDCRNRGGTFVNAGRYGDPFCVKDGKIVIIWKRYGPVENP